MSYETTPQGPEAKAGKLSPEQAAQHRERLRDRIEKGAESAQEHSNAEREARREVANEALPAAEYAPGDNESASQRGPHVPTRREKQHSFDTTMHHVRKGLRPAERSFSRLVHQPTVEKVSDIAGKTITRPSGVIGATAFGLIGLLALFGIAKYVGFQLSGSEMPLLLLTGFAVGLLTEWLYKAIRSIVGSNNTKVG